MIETDTEMIDAAADFGFKVYYGDGTRLDILHAAGAAEAGVILVCVDDREAALADRRALQGGVPAGAGAGPRLRPAGRRWGWSTPASTGRSARRFDSALALGEETLRTLGVPEEEVAEIMEDVRERDQSASSASSSAASPRRGTSSAATYRAGTAGRDPHLGGAALLDRPRPRPAGAGGGSAFARRRSRVRAPADAARQRQPPLRGGGRRAGDRGAAGAGLRGAPRQGDRHHRARRARTGRG